MKIDTKLIRLGLAMALFLTSNMIYAQSESRSFFLNFGLNAGVPTTSGYNYAIGADIRLQRDLSRSVAAIGSIGYSEFQQGRGSGIADFAFIPVKLGAKVFPLQRLYLSGEVGTAVKQHRALESQFIWAPGAGYTFNNGLDLGLRYEESRRRGVPSGQVAFRVAYSFNLSDAMQRF